MSQPSIGRPQPAAGAVVASNPEAPYCRNCGAPLNGAYCADCSQRADVHMPSTRELIGEAFEGITHSDSRLWTTLRYLLFKPGKLTQEFVAGRRVAYLPPFRLYLVMSVLFFLSAGLSQKHVVGFNSPDRPASNAAAEDDKSTQAAPCTIGTDIGPKTRDFLQRACNRVVADNGATFKHEFMATIPKAMFIFLPLIAFFHMLLYWRPRHRYAEHLLFFVHVHAFAFLAMTLIWLLDAISSLYKPFDTIGGTLIAAQMIYIPVYVVIALRRVFKRSRWNTLVKATALFFIYVSVLGFTMLGVAIYAAWQL